MNSIPKVSSLPMKKLISSTCSSTRSLGVQVASASPKTKPMTSADIENIVQMNSPAELKNAFGFDKCFVETRGNEILAVAATKKLLLEEKLRQSLLNVNIPNNRIINQITRGSPVVYEPLCAGLTEEL